MSKTAFEGQKRYDALRKAQRGDQHKAAGGASAAGAVAPRLKDKGEGVALRARPSVVGRTHCGRHCFSFWRRHPPRREEDEVEIVRLHGGIPRSNLALGEPG